MPASCKVSGCTMPQQLQSYRYPALRTSCKRLRPQNICCIRDAAAQKTADVVVIGAGVIGLSICSTLLKKSGGNLRLALLEKHQPCFGATGAGQGYIWLAHRNVGSPAWQMAVWSKALWEQTLTKDLASALEWQDSGSILLARTEAEAAELKVRAARLEAEGLKAELLDSQQLQRQEPALQSTGHMQGLLLPSDAQLNGRLAAKALLEQCAVFGDRFCFAQGEGAAELLRGRSGSVQGVLSDSGLRYKATKAVVLAAGAWSGQILAAALGNAQWQNAFSPRKGHLLEVELPNNMPALRQGLMEGSYASHYVGNALPGTRRTADITFTATAGQSGRLLIGSSREFAGFDNVRSAEVESAILARAAEFLPQLKSVTPADSETRVGLRPFSATGPAIGAVPGAPNLFIACGHEGSGLTLAPATAEFIARSILGETLPDFAHGMAPSPPL